MQTRYQAMLLDNYLECSSKTAQSHFRTPIFSFIFLCRYCKAAEDAQNLIILLQIFIVLKTKGKQKHYILLTHQLPIFTDHSFLWSKVPKQAGGAVPILNKGHLCCVAVDNIYL